MQNLLTFRARCLSVCIGAALTVALGGCPQPGPTPPGTPSGPGTGPAIAGGLNIEILSTTIPLDRRPVVQFFATDDQGNGIPIEEMDDARFILGFLEDPPEGSTARYVSYSTDTESADVKGTVTVTQASYDPARLDGLSQAEDGTYTYKFDTELPITFSRSATHQIAGQFERVAAVNGVAYPANVAESFRPDGRAVQRTREIVSTESCNQCHTRLAEHGGVRREIQLCIMCHNEQSTDAETGNSLDLAVMVHKIHYGEDLPSVQDGEPFQLSGFRDRIFDFSDVVYPQEIVNCTSCHTGAPQADVWKESPTLAGCASCHDRTWFGNPDETPMGYANHIGGQQVDNSLCAICHTAEGPAPSPIVPAHIRPDESSAAPGLALNVADVRTSTSAKGETGMVEIDFTAVDGDGNPITDLSALDIVAATVAWPARQYQNNVRETIQSGFGGPDGTVTNNGGGSFTYAFANSFPMTTDTFAVAMEGRRPFMFRGEELEQGTSTNGQMFFTMDGSAPQMPRQIIDAANCNMCHREIRAHGELRVGVEFCAMCHHVNNTDAGQRPMDDFPPETINFKDMIHGIHRGEDLDTDLTIFGFGGRPFDFTEVRFPGELQECGICHSDGESYTLPLPEVAEPTTIAADSTVFSVEQPARAACTSCHDRSIAEVHAVLATDPVSNVESCAVCHGPNRDAAVAAIHALEP